MHHHQETAPRSRNEQTLKSDLKLLLFFFFLLRGSKKLHKISNFWLHRIEESTRLFKKKKKERNHSRYLSIGSGTTTNNRQKKKRENNKNRGRKKKKKKMDDWYSKVEITLYTYIYIISWDTSFVQSALYLYSLRLD